MEFNEVLKERKSIRSYEYKEITKDEIKELIEFSNLAPSWKNSQTVRYHIILSDKMKESMQKEGLAPFNAQRTKEASVYIVISFVKDISGFNEDKTPINEMGQGWGYYDAGIATNKLILKACQMGYGSLIMGIRDAEAIRKMLQIPNEEIITSVVAIGKTKVIPERNKRKELDEIMKIY